MGKIQTATVFYVGFDSVSGKCDGSLACTTYSSVLKSKAAWMRKYLEVEAAPSAELDRA